VRLIHASPDSPAVDIYVNGSPVVENLAYGAGTEFATLPAGNDREIQIVATGGSLDTALFETSVDFGEGKAYDVIAVDLVEHLDAMVENVDLSAVADGQARLRVFHAAPDIDDVSVVVTDGPTLVDGVGFKDVSDYQNLDAGTYDIQVKQGDDVLLRVEDFTIEAGEVYDVLVFGRSEDDSLQLIAFSSPAEVPLGGGSSAELGSTPMTAAESTPELVATPAG
jgi:hypothetical protein